MATYTREQIYNTWFALNLNRLIPNNEAYSGAGLHNPNRSINMYKWLQDALTLIGVGPITLPLNTKGDILTYTTTLAKLGVGSNGQVLTADSSTATGLKWATPSTPPGYIPPVTTKGDIFTFDTIPNRLPLGTNNQVLTVDTSTATGLKWATPSGGYTSPLTTKGDIFVRGASDTRLPVGTNGQFLSADSSEATGLKWVAAPGGGTNIYNANGTLTSNRTVDLVGYSLIFNDVASPGIGVTSINNKLTIYDLETNATAKTIYNDSTFEQGTVAAKVFSGGGARASIQTIYGITNNSFEAIQAEAKTLSTGDSVQLNIGAGDSTSFVGMNFLATVTSNYRNVSFYIPTLASSFKRYMSTTETSTSTVSNVKYTYPLERRDFYFADSMQGTTVLNAISKTGLTTDSDGASRSIVKVTMSCTGNAGTSGADSIEITLYRHDNSVVYTALIATPPVSAGKLFEADLYSTPITLSANSTYYAKVTVLNGVSSATKGLTLTVYTI